jgi:hypothetical protein
VVVDAHGLHPRDVHLELVGAGAEVTLQQAQAEQELHRHEAERNATDGLHPLPRQERHGERAQQREEEEDGEKLLVHRTGSVTVRGRVRGGGFKGPSGALEDDLHRGGGDVAEGVADMEGGADHALDQEVHVAHGDGLAGLDGDDAVVLRVVGVGFGVRLAMSRGIGRAHRVAIHADVGAVRTELDAVLGAADEHVLLTAREVPESTGHLVFARCHGVRAPVETGEVQHLPALAHVDLLGKLRMLGAHTQHEADIVGLVVERGEVGVRREVPVGRFDGVDERARAHVVAVTVERVGVAQARSGAQHDVGVLGAGFAGQLGAGGDRPQQQAQHTQRHAEAVDVHAAGLDARAQPAGHGHHPRREARDEAVHEGLVHEADHAREPANGANDDGAVELVDAPLVEHEREEALGQLRGERVLFLVVVEDVREAHAADARDGAEPHGHVDRRHVGDLVVRTVTRQVRDGGAHPATPPVGQVERVRAARASRRRRRPRPAPRAAG